jgi:hypothetical protein
LFGGRRRSIGRGGGAVIDNPPRIGHNFVMRRGSICGAAASSTEIWRQVAAMRRFAGKRDD